MVALVGKHWNEIIAELKEWHAFGEHMKKEATIAFIGVPAGLIIPEVNPQSHTEFTGTV